MPDFERVIRDLELHVAPTPEAKAYVKGKHDGLDIARKQVLNILLTGLMVVGLVIWAAPLWR